MSVPLDVEIPPYTEPSALAFERSLESRLLQVPGVQSLAWVSLPPFSGAPISEVRLDTQSRGQGHPASIDNVSQDFFSTFGIRLMHGRSFTRADASSHNSTHVAIVSHAFARAFWGNRDPVGQVVVTPDDRHLLVIGVARDTRSERFSILDGPRLYTLRNEQELGGQLYVRFSGDAASVAASFEHIVKSLDGTQEGTPSTIWDFLESNATDMRSLAKIILFMASIAVVLAITGAYSVLTFAISQRTREFGIQMTLGATRESIFAAVMKRGLRQVALGFVLGMAIAFPAAWAWMRITKNSWMPFDSLDPSVYTIAALILLVVSLSAMCLPALRQRR